MIGSIREREFHQERHESHTWKGESLFVTSKGQKAGRVDKRAASADREKNFGACKTEVGALRPREKRGGSRTGCAEEFVSSASS